MAISSPLTLTFPEIKLGDWMPILGSGIGISITPGTLLKSFLCDQLSIQPDYLENRIQTILVNAKAIDDVKQIHLTGGDVIALSAAMPGLAGTTLRKGSHLAEMRRTITHHPSMADAPHIDAFQKEVVTLKLFNLVAREIGPKLLGGQIYLKEKDLNHLMTRYPIPSPPKPAIKREDWIEVQLETSTQSLIAQ